MLRKFCWVQRLFTLMIFGLFILSISSMLSGCGNKGDLYLPENGSADKPKTSPNNNPVKKKS